MSRLDNHYNQCLKCTEEEISVCLGISKWREAVENASTVSRLHVLMGIMDASIKWEKSAENAVKISFISVAKQASWGKKSQLHCSEHRRHHSEKNKYLEFIFFVAYLQNFCFWLFFSEMQDLS